MSEKILYFEVVKNNINSAIEIIKESNKDINDLSQDELKELFVNIPEKFLQDFNYEYMENEIDNFHKNNFIEFQENIDVLEKGWGSACAYYALFIDFYVGFSDSFTELIKQYGVDIKDNDYILSSLRYLNGRVIQIANGILVLLRNGYPDDGYARNRTLYELLITISFIVEYGETVAKDYIEYTGNWYHWAKSVINKKHIIFADLEQNCGLDKTFINKWKIGQKDMHKLVHASPQGTFGRFGGYMKNSIPIGPTDMGIDLVSIDTIRLLNAIFISYLRCIEDTDILEINNLIKSYFLTLKNISDKMEQEFNRLKKLNFTKIDKEKKHE